MIVFVLSVFAVLLVTAIPKSKARAQRIFCINNLMQIGLATRVWEGDHTNTYPKDLPAMNGGTMEFVSGPNAFRHFMVMSNELNAPLVLICPAESDRNRFPATNFVHLSNSNLSYFVGLDVNETDPQGILFGDRNLTNGTAMKSGVLQLTANSAAGWTDEMHKQFGNIALADGSVEQVSTIGLRVAFTNTNASTTRLLMPILGP